MNKYWTLYVQTCIWGTKWFVPAQLNHHKYLHCKWRTLTKPPFYSGRKYLNLDLGDKVPYFVVMLPPSIRNDALDNHSSPSYSSSKHAFPLSILKRSLYVAVQSAHVCKLPCHKKGGLSWALLPGSLEHVYAEQWSVDHTPLASHSLGSLLQCRVLVHPEPLTLNLCLKLPFYLCTELFVCFVHYYIFSSQKSPRNIVDAQ